VLSVVRRIPPGRVASYGEIAALANTINEMTDTLAVFADQVTTVARDWSAVGFVNGTQRLAATSPFYRAAGDGNDLGADVDAMMAAIEGVGGAGCSTRPENPTESKRPK